MRVGPDSTLKVFSLLPDTEIKYFLQIRLIWSILYVVLTLLTLNQTAREALFHQFCLPQFLHPFLEARSMSLHPGVRRLQRSATTGPFFSLLPLYNFQPVTVLLDPLADILESGEYINLPFTLKVRFMVFSLFILFIVFYDSRRIREVFTSQPYSLLISMFKWL